jgi:hypothetical protein
VRIIGIKHMATAVANVNDALAQYQRFLGIAGNVKPMDLFNGGSREAALHARQPIDPALPVIRARAPFRAAHRDPQ